MATDGAIQGHVTQKGSSNRKSLGTWGTPFYAEKNKHSNKGMSTVSKHSLPELWLRKAASGLEFTAAVCGVCLDTLGSRCISI